jgi:predicted small lipoprotein YifL
VTKPAAELSRRALLPAAIAALLALAGCGIKGPLELPEGAKAAKETQGKGRRAVAADLPGYRQSSRDKRNYKQLGKGEKPDEPFILDPLLK